LSASAVQTHDLDLSLRATFAKNKQRIENLPATVPRFPAPGSFGAAFGRNFISPGGETTWIWGNVPLDANGNPLPIGVRVTAGCSPGAPGCIIARTADTVAGNYNPDFVMEFSSSLRWKRLTLATTVSWQQGGSVADMTRTLWDEGGTSRDYDDPITRETMGDGWNLNAPAGYTQGQFRYDSWAGGGDVRAYVASATNVRIRDISLSYQAPDSWLQSVGARSLRLSVQARNPLVFSHYWSYDPEFNNFGTTNLNRFIDLAPFPSNRQFYLSVDVGW